MGPPLTIAEPIVGSAIGGVAAASFSSQQSSSWEKTHPSFLLESSDRFSRATSSTWWLIEKLGLEPRKGSKDEEVRSNLTRRHNEVPNSVAWVRKDVLHVCWGGDNPFL